MTWNQEQIHHVSRLRQIVFTNFCGTRGCACNFVSQCGKSVYSSFFFSTNIASAHWKFWLILQSAWAIPWAICLIATNQRRASYQAQSNWQYFGGKSLSVVFSRTGNTSFFQSWWWHRQQWFRIGADEQLNWSDIGPSIANRHVCSGHCIFSWISVWWVVTHLSCAKLAFGYYKDTHQSVPTHKAFSMAVHVWLVLHVRECTIRLSAYAIDLIEISEFSVRYTCIYFNSFLTNTHEQSRILRCQLSVAGVQLVTPITGKSQIHEAVDRLWSIHEFALAPENFGHLSSFRWPMILFVKCKISQNPTAV